MPSQPAEALAMACCHDPSCSSAGRSDALNSPRWRRALWIALAINAGFFVAEIVAGAAAGSAALQADALDFFGDAANYAISLGVAGMALTWRARAAVAKGGTLIAFPLWGLARISQTGKQVGAMLAMPAQGQRGARGHSR